MSILLNLFVIFFSLAGSAIGWAGGPACFPHEACRFHAVPEVTTEDLSSSGGIYMDNLFRPTAMVSPIPIGFGQSTPIGYTVLGATAGALNGWAAAELSLGKKAHPDTYFRYFPYASYGSGHSGSPAFWYFLQN